MMAVYTSAYNLLDMGFDWRSTLDNWVRFLGNGQIVIAVNTSKDDTLTALTEYSSKIPQIEWTIIRTEIPYENARFDGLIKDEALKRCRRPLCALLDMDELFPLSARETWNAAIRYLERDFRFDGLLIPTLDLFHDEKHIKGMGYKFYLHRNHPNIGRGVVVWGDKGDYIDVKRSDTTEAIYRDSRELIRCLPTVSPTMSELARLDVLRKAESPYIWHAGWMNKQQRLRQSAFWAPHWNNRAQAEIEKPLDISDLDKIPYFPHNLPHWNQE